MAVCETGSAIMAYFYFDFRDLNMQTCHHLLRSLVFQLSTRSIPCGNILHRVYKTHENGTRQPSDDTLKACLEEMLRLLVQGRIFIILDALDECPDSSGIPSHRDEVLQLVKELVDLRLHELHICVTSRPEVDIRAVLQPLAFRSVSLHDESGQRADIADYVQSVVTLSPSAAMRRWKAEDRTLVIETLTERADGMFRWVFCQLEALRHCFPSNLRQFLNKLPDTLDETYERMLRGINKARVDDAYRLLQCLTVAVRPLRVEELAEVLAFDFQASRSGGIPTLKADWRWDDQEEAVLSTCSSLISIIRNGRSRVVQFSHFSVKEYLTSPRLALSPHGHFSQFHIDLESAHTIMAQACLGTLLRPDNHAGDGEADESPLLGYAARHWLDHAQFENVSSRVWDGIDNLFDSSKPHFATWLQVHDMDEEWIQFWMTRKRNGSPLYYAALCGFYDLADRLITKYPDQVNARGSYILAPLPAALFKKHFRLANLLHKHGADVGCRGVFERSPIHSATMGGYVDVMRWLLNHGADANTRSSGGITPLHWAAHCTLIECVQVLLGHNANINLQDDDGQTPLYWLTNFWTTEWTEHRLDTARRLLEHGADPNICSKSHSTPLHQASSRGSLEAARLLPSYGAKVDAKNGRGWTPFQVAASKGHRQIMKLLLEHGAVPPS